MKKFIYKFKKSISYFFLGMSIAIGIFAISFLFVFPSDLELGALLMGSSLVIFFFLELSKIIDPDLKKKKEKELSKDEKIYIKKVKKNNKKLFINFFRYTAIGFIPLSILIFVESGDLIVSLFAGVIFAIFLSSIIISFQKYIWDRK